MPPTISKKKTSGLLKNNKKKKKQNKNRKWAKPMNKYFLEKEI